MTKKVSPLLLILATGLPIVLSLVFPDEVEPFMLLLLLGLLGLVFVAGVVVAIDRENYKAAKTGGVLFALIVMLGLANTEYFKSPTVLEAWLKDDLSGLHLHLRKNGQFEMVARTFLSEESFEGKYKLEDDRIIFLNRPYDSDFIPDTLTIWQDKLILAFDADGQPDLSSARYFQIQKNTILPPAVHGATTHEKGSWVTYSPISERDRINWQQYEADLDTAERAAIVQKLKKHFSYIFENEYYGGYPFERTVHPMDLNGDGRLDAIVEGYSGGESTNTQVFLARNGAYEKVLEKYQYVKAIEIEKGRLKSLILLDLGCCADYVEYETRYRISPVFSASPVYQKAKASFGQMPRNRVLSTPRRVVTGPDFTPLRSAPAVEDTTTVIYDAVGCGNTLATYLAGTEGYAWSTETDRTGTKWWYVEMTPGRELDETLLYPKDDIPTRKMGWIREVDLRVIPSPIP